jgi:hypothetical protein
MPTHSSLIPSQDKSHQPHRGHGLTTTLVGLLNKYFYFFMSLLIAVVVVYGFSHTIDKNLIHPDLPRPFLLYLHASIFFGWLAFLILQSALIRTHNVRIHRTIGWFGVALGLTIIVLGVSTAITMARYKILHFHATDQASFLVIPLFDMVCFTTTFALAIYWRRKPEFHRRLILMASCALTAAGFGRFPPQFGTYNWFYAGVDLLIVLGVARDFIVNKRIHPVYLYGLPAFIVGQSIVMYTSNHNPPLWQKIANAILS